MWNDNDGQWHMMGAGGGSAWGMLLAFVLIVIVGVVVLLVVLRGPGQTGADPAARILRDRLARGEIDEPEYESRLRLIQRDELQR